MVLCSSQSQTHHQIQTYDDDEWLKVLVLENLKWRKKQDGILVWRKKLEGWVKATSSNGERKRGGEIMTWDVFSFGFYYN